jgi:phage-related minor tail protein
LINSLIRVGKVKEKEIREIEKKIKNVGVFILGITEVVIEIWYVIACTI